MMTNIDYEIPRSPKLVIPSDPTVDGWENVLAEVLHGLNRGTMHRADKTEFAVLFSNQEFTDYVSLSRSATGEVLRYLSSLLMEYYDVVMGVALKYGVAPHDPRDMQSMEATCLAISDTDGWKTAMSTWVSDNICLSHDWRLEKVNDAYVVGRALNRLLKASKLPWRSAVSTEWRVSFLGF
jgi:hypothetical protein